MHVPLLTKYHRHLRLRWAPEHRDWTMDQWKKVGQMNHGLSFIDGRIRIFISHIPGERFLPQCTASHTQDGGGGIMLWRTFSWVSLESVVVVKQTLNATEYLNIIADQLHSYMASVFRTRNEMFQQDNAPCHKARIVLEWFYEHDTEFQLMSQLPGSLDRNPTEHIWNVMERQLKIQIPTSRNISDSLDRCLNILYNLSSAICQGFVASIPRRVVAASRAKGGPIR